MRRHCHVREAIALGLMAALILLGCAVPTAEAPPAPVPPTPEPTEPPAVVATLDDLAGWWQLNFSMDARMHIESDGTWEEYGVGTDALGANQIWGPAYAGHWEPVGDTWEIHRSFGPISSDCVDTVSITVQPDSQLHVLLVESPCSIGHDDVVFTRIDILDDLFACWKPTSGNDMTLALRRDMTYAAWTGEDAVDDVVVWGKLAYDATLSRLEFRDHATSPCGPSKVGTYKTAIAADGSLTFSCVEDLCAERRALIESLGTLLPDDRYDEISGVYRCSQDQNIELALCSCGRMRMRNLADGRGSWLCDGAYVMQGQGIQIVDARGQARCEEGQGLYTVQRDGNSLAFTPIEETCPDRANTLSGSGPWTLVSDM